MRRAAWAAAALLAGCGSGHDTPHPPVLQVAAGREVATAFALGPGRAVTVAHVLGARRAGATVRMTGGRRATVLAIDERDDLALLAVAGLRAPAARLGAGRGSVTVFVVRRGRATALTAQVRRAIVATIRTPDGRRVVRRRALELRADIAPGDSGAPVVTSDGRVAGVVFAQSSARDGVAYATDVSALAALRRSHAPFSTHATAPRSASSAGRNV